MLDNYLIMSKDIVPDYLVKVIEVRKLLEENKNQKISDVCEKVGISRSTYYKYKDKVFYPSESNQERKAVISLVLIHKKGTLSSVLNVLSQENVSVLTISQALPVDNKATVLISLDINNMEGSIENMIDSLKTCNGVKNVQLLAIE